VRNGVPVDDADDADMKPSFLGLLQIPNDGIVSRLVVAVASSRIMQLRQAVQATAHAEGIVTQEVDPPFVRWNRGRTTVESGSYQKN